MKAYIKSRPDNGLAEDQHRQHRLPPGDRESEPVPRPAGGPWRIDVKPRPEHFDKRITVATPLQKAGRISLDGQDEGRQHLVHRPLARRHGDRPQAAGGQKLLLRRRRRRGAPVAKAEVEFFGWQQQWQRPNHIEVFTKQFAEYTDADGQLVMDPQRQPPEYQWLLIARTKAGRFAYLGFSGVWYRKLVRRRIQPSRRSSRSPIGRSIGPSRR